MVPLAPLEAGREYPKGTAHVSTTALPTDATGPAVRSLLSDPRANVSSDSLSDADRENLFRGLKTTLERTENCDEARGKWDVIEAALMRNPGMTRNLLRLQNMGAELVVTDIDDQNVEFADAAINHNIPKQENALARLAEVERDNAIEQILQPLEPDQRASPMQWILSRLLRPDNTEGLNWVEAMVFAVAHGGTLISYDAYDAMAKKNPSIFENLTWNWYLANLSGVMASGTATGGSRYVDGVSVGEVSAGYRSGDQGARVVVRVPLAA